ncbi:hypothetical protein ACFWNC_05055 [Streptomyces sp. NPDC058369]|uniref:hypothetical protein n=1 Tax=unclassified Streptomyces TaxID=2593676 RepID=UPI002250DF27|nr:hypothetical protein [Streptomyces sp. NBC_01789]MCX4451215.1 hypothetical protein [Streptomyces sp. NBC_01789]
MTGQTAKITSPCECGTMAMRQVNQFILHDELWWDSEFSCGSCGTYLCEHAGPGPAPAEVREALLAAHGPVKLRLVSPVPSLVPVLKVFREATAASLSQARELVGELSHDGLVGTLPEMEFLKARLQMRAVPVDIDR